jgi:mannose-6-phosphate isomerase-like protein (cupin superfamily)
LQPSSPPLIARDRYAHDHPTRVHPDAVWVSQRLVSVAGAHLRYRVMRDTAGPFHVHAESPECFFVLSGTLHVDTAAGTVAVQPGQLCQVPPGLEHRARVAGEATLLVLDGLAPQS